MTFFFPLWKKWLAVTLRNDVINSHLGKFLLQMGKVIDIEPVQRHYSKSDMKQWIPRVNPWEIERNESKKYPEDWDQRIGYQTGIRLCMSWEYGMLFWLFLEIRLQEEYMEIIFEIGRPWNFSWNVYRMLSVCSVNNYICGLKFGR